MNIKIAYSKEDSTAFTKNDEFSSSWMTDFFTLLLPPFAESRGYQKPSKILRDKPRPVHNIPTGNLNADATGKITARLTSEQIIEARLKILAMVPIKSGTR